MDAAADADRATSPFSWLWTLIMSLDLSFLYVFFRNQFRRLPPPQDDFSGQTIIVTGANVGLGLEAARHFARLGAARVILASRSADQGARAKADIERSLSSSASTSTSRTSAGVVLEVWPLDLASFDSVRAFCARAAALPRVDAVVENAGVALVSPRGTLAEGYERTITVNVISTFLMALLLLPTLRRTAARFNVQPRLVIVSSDAHFMAAFKERSSPRIFDAFKSTAVAPDRYQTSKLLEILVVRQLAAAMSAPGSTTKGTITLTTLNPGFCRTALFRDNTFPASLFLACTTRLLGRSAEMGSRVLVWAAAAARGPEEVHGRWLDSCEVREPSPFVRSAEGAAVQARVYEELMGILEGVEPGVTKNI